MLDGRYDTLLVAQANLDLWDYLAEGVLLTNKEGVIVACNRAFTLISGYTREELIGQRPVLFQSGIHDDAFYSEMWETLKANGSWRGVLWNRNKYGEVFGLQTCIRAIVSEDGQLLGHQSISLDLSRVGVGRHGDGATSIIARDRSSFLNSLKAQISSNPDGLCAVCVLDVDGFSRINEAHGYKSGDLILLTLIERLRDNLRNHDFVTRLSGDEFAFVVPDLHSHDELEPILRRIHENVQRPVTINGVPTEITVSLGTTVFPYDLSDAETLIQHASRAVEDAKHAGGAAISYYQTDIAEEDPDLIPNHQANIKVMSGLRHREMVMYYQPKVMLTNGAVIGFESLIRWDHPTRGLISPADFLSKVRSRTLLAEIGEWGLSNALAQIDLWRRSRGIMPKVAVNIVAEQLRSSRFVRTLVKASETYPDVPLSCLEIEVIEVGTIHDIDQMLSVMCACRDLGVTFSMDEFSSGAMTLSSLRHLPVDEIKIDHSFIRGMLDTPSDMIIVRSIVDMGKSLGRRVIAEGVENQAQLDKLREIGCEYAQGYVISRPMRANEVVEWVDAGQTRQITPV